jgi:hypothetical protein
MTCEIFQTPRSSCEITSPRLHSEGSQPALAFGELQPPISIHLRKTHTDQEIMCSGVIASGRPSPTHRSACSSKVLIAASGRRGADISLAPQLTITPHHRAAKGLAPIIDFLKATDAQRGIPSADIAAHPHCAKCLAQCAEGERLVRPGPGHDRP